MNIEDKLKEVRAEYTRRMISGSNSFLLQQVEQYVTAREGKMLRPRMTLLSAATLGEDVFNSRRTLLLATVVEMLHNASLIHDDVIDNDVVRRGNPSVNARWGNQVAVLVGDYILAQIMRLLDEVEDTAASRLVNRTVEAMVESELLQLEISSRNDYTIEQYIQVIDGKTARLFATAAALGNKEYEEFGLHYGRLFQLRDDVADDEITPFTNELMSREEGILSTLKCLPIQ